MKHYELMPVGEHLKQYVLVFDWDEETGEITGRDAEEIKACAKPYGVAHTSVLAVRLSAEPLKSRRDMAAICSGFGGMTYILPDDLAAAQPVPEYPDDIDPEIMKTIIY